MNNDVNNNQNVENNVAPVQTEVQVVPAATPVVEQPVVQQVQEQAPVATTTPVVEVQPVQAQPVAQPQVVQEVQPAPAQEPTVQPQVIQQPVQQVVQQPAQPQVMVSTQNYYQGFNSAASNGQKKKKKISFRLVFDLIILAVVVGFAIFIIFPSSKDPGTGPIDSRIINLDENKKACLEAALKHIDAKYGIKPDLTDIAIDKVESGTEYCTMSFLYNKKEFQAAYYVLTNNEIFQDNYQYNEILKHVTEEVKNGIKEELYQIELSIPNVNSALEIKCPNCIVPKVNTKTLNSTISGSTISLYFKNKYFDEEAVLKYVSDTYLGSHKMNFRLYSYQDSNRAKKSLKDEEYKEYYLYKNLLISVASGTNQYAYTEYNRYDTYDLGDINLVFFGKRLKEEPEFNAGVISQDEQKTCYKIEYNGFGNYKNYDEPNFSIYSYDKRTVSIQNTPVVFQQHEASGIYYSINRFVIYSDYANFSIEMCVDNAKEEEKPEEEEEEEEEEETPKDRKDKIREQLKEEEEKKKKEEEAAKEAEEEEAKKKAEEEYKKEHGLMG